MLSAIFFGQVRPSRTSPTSARSSLTATRAGWLFVASISRCISLLVHDLFGKPVSTFPDHALVAHDLFGKPVSTFPDHALVAHDLFGTGTHPSGQRLRACFSGSCFGKKSTGT